MTDRLQDKVALITGTGSGIGRATALLFAREGATIVGCDISPERDKETVRLVEQAGGRTHSTAPLDLAEPEQAEAWITAIGSVATAHVWTFCGLSLPLPALFFPFIQVLDAAIGLWAIPLAWLANSNGTWKEPSPARRPEGRPAPPGAGARGAGYSHLQGARAPYAPEPAAFAEFTEAEGQHAIG